MTNGIAAISFAVFLILYLTGHIDNAAVLGGFIPARVGDADLLAGLAAVTWWLTPLTCTLIHAGWLHVGFNMLMLVFCGRHVEHVLGKGPTLLLYGVGAYAACGAQWLIDPGSTGPMVGASGAISAVVATYALLYSQRQVRRIGPFSANVVRLAWLAGGWIALQLMIGFATAGGMGDLGQIAVAAHIGGFLAGLALTRPLLRWRFRKRPRAVN
ncbi:membrane associated rhomboid family serine protease [Sphingobium xenophagum]|uniref:Membrane associated rhomboid family serine protease n=1 Tax=Sphingobium xenophagum TaxID=121428 RepID=A0ABU1WYW4_SPHXE|nr:rhomboid family intramembrane serine protease [Sphingobium xenophagum]MDR7154510.1 membrane associated rhomboid family serine protease [Sphingobium xenophagum]